MDTNSVARAAAIRFVLCLIILPGALILTAGSLNYWQAWLYCAALLVPVTLVVLYFLKNNPEFLVRRMKMKEKEKTQKSIIKWSLPLFLLYLLLPSIDYRFGWSEMPAEWSIAALAAMLLSYFMILLVFKENEYAARTVEVEKGQKVISTGPYALVRHPMYTGFLLMMLATPIALGSYWTLLLFPPIPAIMVLRTLDEEKVLKRDLKGYGKYCDNVRWRLLPYLW